MEIKQLLNNTWVKEITREILKYFELNIVKIQVKNESIYKKRNRLIDKENKLQKRKISVSVQFSSLSSVQLFATP